MTATPEVGFWTGSIAYSPAVGPAVTISLGASDANGTQWVLNDFSGLDGVPTAGQVVQRAGDHGGYASPQFLAPRPITLTITASAISQAQRDVARYALHQAIPVGSGGGSDLALFTFNEPVAKQCYVRGSGTAVTESCVSTSEVEFTVGLIAPDPRLYSAVQHSAVGTAGSRAAGLAPPWTPPITLPAGAPPASVSVTNAGNFETRPTVTIQGPITAPQVQNVTTGQIVSYSALTLGAGDLLVLDFMNRVGTLNGVYRPADVSSAWSVMPPGATTFQMLGTASSGASMTVSWYDAWI